MIVYILKKVKSNREPNRFFRDEGNRQWTGRDEKKIDLARDI